jgi:hypothetical protein
MQQNKRLAVAELRRIDRAVGEKPIHSRLSFKFKVARLEMPMRKRRAWALIDKSKFRQFKPLSLDVIFHRLPYCR